MIAITFFGNDGMAQSLQHVADKVVCRGQIGPGVTGGRGRHAGQKAVCSAAIVFGAFVDGESCIASVTTSPDAGSIFLDAPVYCHDEGKGNWDSVAMAVL